MKKQKSASFWVAIALILCLISSLGASMVQTGGGAIKYHDITMVTDSGHELDALLLVPKNATRETPAPAIVTSHGWYNNREMQDLNYVEYARRGYVVISISMYGHGDSEIIPDGTWFNAENNANGLYDAVKYIARLPYVDASRIGVTGHSNGALASRVAVMQDEEGLIAAALLVSNDAVYKKDDQWVNIFGSRDAGIVACQYDEFFHRVKQEDGTKSAPRDYIDQNTAQSFLHFGVDPTGLDKRSADTYYTEQIDGKESIRVIFNPAITHPWAHFSKNVVADSVTFFDKALDAPIKLDANNQTWQWKAFFNTVGIAGFFMFVIYAAIALLDARYFAELKPAADAQPLPAPKGKGKGWYWGGLAFGAIMGVILYPTIYAWCSKNRPAFWNQEATWYIGMWTFLCGVFTILVMVVTYNCYSKKNGLDLAERGVKISGRKLWKTIVLSLIVVVAAYALVFISDYLFLTDFRLWCFITIRAFAPMHFATIAKYLVFWLVYYIALSVATNSFNFVQLGKSNWLSTLVQMFFVFIGPEIMIGVQYITFYNKGFLWSELTHLGGSITGIWLYPIVFMLPLAVFVCSKIYKKSKNPYIGGIIMGILACVVSVTNTLTLG